MYDHVRSSSEEKVEKVGKTKKVGKVEKSRKHPGYSVTESPLSLRPSSSHGSRPSHGDAGHAPGATGSWPVTVVVVPGHGPGLSADCDHDRDRHYISERDRNSDIGPEAQLHI